MKNSENSQPLVAIGVPVYNGGEYLRECLESILIQTYNNWECIIVDNKSNDDTNKIAKEFAEKDSRFVLIENEEFVDQTTNWNISYYKSPKEAKYFKIVCADDWLFPSFLEKMVPILEGDESVGFCSSYRIDDKEVRCGGLDYYQGSYFEGRKILVEQLKNSLDVTGSINSLLFRNSTLQRLDYFPEIFLPNTYHIDTILAYDVLNISNLGFVFEVLSYTRRHNETYTSTISEKFNTGYYFREMELYKFLDLDPSFKPLYKKLRLNYAYFLLKNKIKNNKQCIDWHKKYLERKISPSEYFVAFLTRNVLSRQFLKIT